MKRKLNGKPIICVGQLCLFSFINQSQIRFLVYLITFQFLLNLSEPLKIQPKSCSNALGEQGTCMFVWECIKTEGRHLGTCVDGFLFGSCCLHNETLNQLDSGSSSPVKPYYSNGISAAYHSEHEYTTANLDVVNNNSGSNLTSYVNFNNNPPNDNDIYHVHETSNSSPVQTMFSTISSVNPSINLQFVPSTSNSATTATSATNFHNHHNFNNYQTQPDNDDHRRPHTHNHSNHNPNHSHMHHHNYENFHTHNGDKSSHFASTTSKPTSSHSFINFNLTNHLIPSNSKPTYKPFQFHTTTVLPPSAINYNPFKPANHSFLISNKNATINKPNLLANQPIPNGNNKPISTANNAHHSTWSSFYKPWSNKPNNGK